MTLTPVKAGVIGCGNISAAYLRANALYEAFDIVAVADLDLARAQERAQEFNIPRACTVDELLADDAVELIINLTIPKAHAEVNLAALAAGKHVHTEKPFAVTREEGRAVLEVAAKAGRLTGGAPDTFLGGAHQFCRKLIDDGWIGRPVAATAFMLGHGHESWHPDPEFYYEVGGGPMFDMGPYYLTALVNLLGPVQRVTGSAQISFPQRTITSTKKHGKVIDVEVPTHVAGVLDFASGAVATIITSFDIWAHGLPCIEIYGSAGSLRVPDPNGFGGTVQVFRPHGLSAALDDPTAGACLPGQWLQLAWQQDFIENQRGAGPADMAYALRCGRPHRASGALAYHVLDIMHAFHDASTSGRHVDLASTCERPAALPTGLKPGTLDG